MHCSVRSKQPRHPLFMTWFIQSAWIKWISKGLRTFLKLSRILNKSVRVFHFIILRIMCVLQAKLTSLAPSNWILHIKRTAMWWRRWWQCRWQWCWWHRYVGYFMTVTDFKCWWQNHYIADFFHYVGDFLNVLNRSPTSQTCHQHIWSPTFVTNIDVTA